MQKAFSSDSAVADWKKTFADGIFNKDQYLDISVQFSRSLKLTVKRKKERK